MKATNNLTPLVSVLVPCYNHERFVEETIISIISQSYKNIELIVIDDGSKDTSPLILEKLSKKYNFYYEHQKNMGLPATLNKMIKMAKGKYISIIASDDINTLDKIELLVEEFEQLPDEYGVVCGNAKFIDDKNNEICLEQNGQQYCTFIEMYISINKTFNIQDFGTYPTFLVNNYIPVMSTLIKRDALLKVNLYEENITIEDWNMWMKLARTYKMKYVNSIVAFYRWHEHNSMKTMNEQLRLDTLKIFKREQAYCYANGLKNLWEHQYYGALLNFLLLKKYVLFYEYINIYNIYGFLKFLIKKLITRII